MIKNISEFASGSSSLEYDKDGNPTDFDAKVAIVALLARAACCDDAFTAEELTSMVSCLTKEFDVTESSIGQLLEVARLLMQDADKSETLLNLVRDRFSRDQKENVLAILWRVVMADGKVSKAEAVIAAQVRQYLGLSMEQAARARLMAEKGNVGWLADAVEVSTSDKDNH